jgi:hypothetical protein
VRWRVVTVGEEERGVWVWCGVGKRKDTWITWGNFLATKDKREEKQRKQEYDAHLGQRCLSCPPFSMSFHGAKAPKFLRALLHSIIIGPAKKNYYDTTNFYMEKKRHGNNITHESQKKKKTQHQY